jgi:hypothetical protein
MEHQVHVLAKIPCFDSIARSPPLIMQQLQARKIDLYQNREKITCFCESSQGVIDRSNDVVPAVFA